MSGPIEEPGEFLRRLGAFSISSEVIRDDPGAVRTALEGCIVLRAEHVFHEHRIHYIALHEDFDEVHQGQLPTQYFCALEKHDDGSVTREWRKEHRSLG